MSFRTSRCHGAHPAPREPLARNIEGARRRCVVPRPPHVQVNLECGQLPAEKVQPDRYVHVMHSEVAHRRLERPAINACGDGDGAPRSESAWNASCAALVSLRIWKA